MKKLIYILLLLIATIADKAIAQSLLPRRNPGVIVTDRPAGSSSPLKDFPVNRPSYKQNLYLDSLSSIYFTKREYKEGKIIKEENFTTLYHTKGKMFFEFLSTMKSNGSTDILLLFSSGDMLKSWHTPENDERWLWKFYQYPNKPDNQEYPIIIIYRSKDIQESQNEQQIPINDKLQFIKSLDSYFIYSYKIIPE